MYRRVVKITAWLMVGFAWLLMEQAQAQTTLWAWGYGLTGSLGESSTLNSSLPLQTWNSGIDLKDVLTADGGGRHTLTLKENGTVVAAGENTYGQLGNGTTRNQLAGNLVKGAGGVGVLSDITALAAAYWHSLALKANGTVWAWGHNNVGQCGDGNTTDRLVPVQVKGTGGIGFLTGVISVSAGENHSLALKPDGTVWGWGYNNVGQLGDNTTTSRTTPVQVKGPGGAGFLTNVIAISVGDNHSLALKSDGTVWAWGYNNVGQLGNGTTTNRTTPTQVLGPGGVGFLTGITALSGGGNHVVALKNDGTAWTWGYNNAGQLGDNTAANRTSPVQVKGAGGSGVLTNLIAVSAGWAHTVALKSDGTAWAWGYNAWGRLGDGTDTNRATPVQVIGPGGSGVLTSVKVINAGTHHTIAIKSDDTAYAWGYNEYGQLSDGTVQYHAAPAPIQQTGGAGFLTNIVMVSGGDYHSVALKQDGTVWTWGYNNVGQSGVGTKVNHSIPVQVLGPNGEGVLNNIVTVSAGYAHTLALKSDGTVWAWGENGGGQLGNSTGTDSTTPIQVFGQGGVDFLTDVIAIAAIENTSAALKKDGTVWTWGYNNVGQLGDGTITTRTTPVPVKGPGGGGFLGDVVQMRGGGNHFLALKSDGTLWAWGWNANGQLGDGTTTNRTTPVQVKGAGGTGFLSGVVAMGGGTRHSVALRTDGSVWAWGLNNVGQLGDGTTTSRSLPAQVHGTGNVGLLADVVSLSVGEEHTVAILSDGSVRAWGYNNRGQIGDGTGSNRTSPVVVKSPDGAGALSRVIQVSNGGFHSLVLRGEGVLQGNVALENVLCIGIPIRFEFRPQGGGDAIVRVVNSGVQGVFSFTDIPQGDYDVAIKGDRWLQQIVHNVSTVGGSNILNLRVFLRGGDANNDNSVDVFDLDALIQAFDSTPSDANWNEGADLNCDEFVDVLDLDILIRNFDLTGDE